jgi:aldehyde:ferredoxin oxidoreductase
MFLALYQALTGMSYTGESLKECGRRIYALERHINNLQGRDRAYDSHIPPKMTVPLSTGGHKGDRVIPEFYSSILDAYYQDQGWTAKGLVDPATLQKLGIKD